MSFNSATPAPVACCGPRSSHCPVCFCWTGLPWHAAKSCLMPRRLRHVVWDDWKKVWEDELVFCRLQDCCLVPHALGKVVTKFRCSWPRAFDFTVHQYIYDTSRSTSQNRLWISLKSLMTFERTLKWPVSIRTAPELKIQFVSPPTQTLKSAT